jgi:hypothetical protein
MALSWQRWDVAGQGEGSFLNFGGKLRREMLGFVACSAIHEQGFPLFCVTTKAGNAPLREACHHALHWQKEVLFAVQCDPALVRETSCTGTLALHKACIAGAPLAVVGCMVKAHSGALSAANSGDQMPLHLVCINHITANVLQFLIQQNKAAADAHN